MDNRLKRFLSLAMAIIMVIGLMPANIVFATENEGDASNSGESIVTDGNGGDTSEQGATAPSEQDPAQVPAPLSGEGAGAGDNTHECNFNVELEELKVEATDNTSGSKTMKCENCDETQIVKVCALKCRYSETEDDGHAGDCLCNKNDACVLPVGHDELCEDKDGKLLVGSSTVSGVSGLSAAVEVDGSTIVLTDNIVLTAPVTITKTIILDMNGKSITVAAPGENQPVPDYALINEGTLTVKGNGTIVGIDNKETGNLTILNGTIIASVIDSATDPVTYAVRNSGNAAFGAEGQENSPEFQVSDDVNHGKFAIWNEAKATNSKSMTITKGTYEGVYNHYGVLNIDGGNLNATTGNHAVQSVDGKLDIDGGTFQKNEAGVAVVHVSEHCIATIDGASISNHSSLALELTDTAEVSIGTDSVINDGIKVEGDAKLTVTGGTFKDTGTDNYLPAEYDENLKISVQGGTFIDTNAQKFATRYAAPGKILTFQKESTGTTGNMVKSGEQTVGKVVAMIGDFAYASIQAAVDGAKAKDVIKMVSDAANAEVTVQNGKEVTLDLNGKTVASIRNVIEVQTGGNLTITESATGGTVAAVENYGNVTVIGGTVTKLIAREANADAASAPTTLIKGGKVIELEARVNFTANTVGNIVTIENSVQGETKVVPTVVTITACRPKDSTITSKVYIKGGQITSTISTYQFDENYERISGSSIADAIFITGGTFNIKPATGYIVDGYEIIGTASPYEVRLKIVDLKAPDGTEQEVLVNNSGSTVSLDTVLKAIEDNEKLYEVTNNSGYTLVIRPLQIVLDAGSPYKTSSITYDVFLKDKPQSEKYAVTFNLPIPGTLPAHSKIANVYHEDDLMGEYEIEGEGEQRYVTVTVDSFSKFRVEVTDIDPTSHVAKIGIKGYDSVGAALTAAKDGDEIILLDPTGNTGHTYGSIAISGSNDKQVTIDGCGYEWAYNGTDSTISISGTKAVTIKNVKFSTTNAGSAGNPRAIINISGSTTASVQIQNCTFTGPGTGSNVVGINLNNTKKNVVISGPEGTRADDAVDASGLTVFLKNTGSENLTVRNMKITSCTNGMELDNIKSATLENVDITTTVQGAYGISMRAVRDQHNTVFTDCSISAPLPIMVYGREENATTGGTAHGTITFNGNNTMDGGVFNGKYWLVVADNKYTSANFNTNPSTLPETTGRMIITVNDAGLKEKADGINYKHADEANNKYYTVMPTGELKSAEVIDGENSHILFDIQNLKASERIVIRVYDQHGEIIAQTHLVDTNKQYLYRNALSATHDAAPTLGIAKTKIGNYWSADWKFVHNEYAVPIFRHVPVKAELVIDGKVFPKFDIVMDARDIPTADKNVWTDIDGVGNLTLTTGGKTTWKHTLAEAFTAVPEEGSGLVKLYDDNTAILSAKGEITGGKEVTITTVDYKGDGITPVTLNWGNSIEEYLFVGRSFGTNTGDGKLIFDGAHIKADAATDTTGIHVSGAKKDHENVCNGTLEIRGGSVIELDYLLNKNNVLITGDNTKLTILNGFASGGRPATETADGKAAVSTITVEDGAVMTIMDKKGVATNQHLGLGYEGYGILNVDDATFEYVGDFYIENEVGTDLNVSGRSTLKITSIVNKFVNNTRFGKAVNMLDGAELVDSTIGGDVIIQGTENDPKDVTFTGENTIGALILGYGKVHITTESVLTADKVSYEAEVNEVIIDATNLDVAAGVKVIDFLAADDATKNMIASAMVFVVENKAAKKIETDGDVFVYFEAYIDNDGDKDLDIGEGYATIEKAVEKAAKDKTVVLLADATVEAPVEISKNIVLDLNKKTIHDGSTTISVLKVTASDLEVKNGRIDAYDSKNTGIEVVENAAVELTGVQIDGNVAGIKASGNVTIGEGTTVTARYSYPAVIANEGAVVTVAGGTINNGDRPAIEMNKDSVVTINGGEVKGAPAVRVYGGTLTVNGGTVSRKSTAANAIETSPNSESGRGVSRVVIKNGEITGPIIAEDVAQNVVVPNDYKVSVVIEGGNFTASGLDENYVKKDYVEIAVSRAKADVPTTFDNFVPFEMIVPDFTCQKVKDSNPVKYEIVPYEHVRIYMNNVDDGDLDGDGRADYKIFVGDDAYVDGDAYEVQPGKVLLISKDLAKKSEMFITTYAYNDNETPEVKKDDYPEAMYVWYAKGKTKVGNTYTAYDVERVAELDNFFLYNGTSIRVGGSSNGIRFFSSVDAGDANKLMNGSLIDRADSVLYEAEMTAAGTQFWKTEDNKLQSEVFGGTVGAFRVFQQYQGRNWFTGVLVGLDTDGKTIVDSIYSRPYAAIKVGDKTVNLYGGILDRSIYLVAEQNKDVFTDGSSYDKFVEDLIVKGDEYLASLNNNNNSGTGSEGGTGTGTTGNS